MSTETDLLTLKLSAHEAFLSAIAERLNCLPSFADPLPTSGNKHIIGALDALLDAKESPATEGRSGQTGTTNKDYKKFSGSDIVNAFVSGYEQGHNDTVESCYGCSEERANEYLNEPENFS